MELDRTFGTYRRLVVEAEPDADGRQTLLRTCDPAVAAELGFSQHDSAGRFIKWVGAGEVSGYYRETWWGELEGHTVQLMRDEGDNYFIYTGTPGLAERWNLGLVDPRDPYTAIGMVPKDAVANVRCRRGSFEI